MRKAENNCVGCAAAYGDCSLCGRNEEVVFFCDDCGMELDEDRFADGEKDLCLECLAKRHAIRCDKCGAVITDQAYRDGSSVYCLDCLAKIFEE